MGEQGVISKKKYKQLYIPIYRAIHDYGHFPFELSLETVLNGTELSWENFQKVWEQLGFWNANPSTESSANSAIENEWKKTFWKKF